MQCIQLTSRFLKILKGDNLEVRNHQTVMLIYTRRTWNKFASDNNFVRPVVNRSANRGTRVSFLVYLITTIHVWCVIYTTMQIHRHWVENIYIYNLDTYHTILERNAAIHCSHCNCNMAYLPGLALCTVFFWGGNIQYPRRQFKWYVCLDSYIYAVLVWLYCRFNGESTL
jgi:hypothetical protein